MKKIVILGPESTGKSTLCAQLAAHYNTVWCPEYAREYLLHIRRPYTYEDLLLIAKGQLALEDEYAAKVNGLHLFIDTDMHVMKIWCEVAFNDCYTWILKQAACREYDLHLLCDVDLPWVKDELREYPDLEFRRKLFKMYKDLLVNGTGKWAIISGTNEERLQAAIRIVDEMTNGESRENRE